MSAGKFFLDTSILVYTFDRESARKQKKAQRLVEMALAGRGCLSFQVIQEFLNLALFKFNRPMTVGQAQRYLDATLIPLCDYYPNGGFYRRALGTRRRWRYGLYDSLIITAALESRCDTLFSEDLEHGQQIEDLTIVNPFEEAAFDS